MTLRNFIEAIATKLTELWPGRRVYVDRIPAGADGNFYVGVIESSQTQGLDRRFRRTVQFQVLNFLRRGDSLGFLDWAEAMYEHFDAIDVPGEGARRVRLTGQKARDGEDQGVYQFFFEADLSLLLAPAPADTMEALRQEEVEKK